ncbi:glycosyltransferase family 2 protein [Allosalinactinospora lopnorensis]|uniref:glycosyltransferase family 2 protein n=1 Tax=Allosalinactinospora lopnorensis TaxID=1352348 RepID=UPI000623B988|nr:glycosyltransferase [Allosalinactinospora lopnorensis]
MPADGTPQAPFDERVSVVVITRNRRDQLLRVLGELARLPERPRVIVVDNASDDGTAEAVARRHPRVRTIRCRGNLGAVARNIGTDAVTTPYVAFCDDDTWWRPGALTRAADVLDAHPGLASVTGRILVGPDEREDPITPELRHSPLPASGDAPGPALLSFLAGATVLRADAFRAAGGFSARLWLGGEEELLALDLAGAGWQMCWREDVVVHHMPSRQRDRRRRRELGIRNTLWTAWLRRPWRGAWRHTVDVLRGAPKDLATARAVLEATAGAGWVLRHRRVVPESVEDGLRALEEPRRRSKARRYIG